MTATDTATRKDEASDRIAGAESHARLRAPGSDTAGPEAVAHGSSLRELTASADPSAEAVIAAQLQHLADNVKARLGTRLRALVLLGGYARGEGGIIAANDRVAAYNDYDLVAVVHGSLHMARRELQRIAAEESARLGIAVDLWPVRHSLGEVPHNLLWLDAALGGARVLCGDASVTQPLASIDARSIPLDECTRLLANRAVGLALSSLEPAGDPLRAARHAHKAVLACGDVRLLAADRYRPTVAQRADALQELVDAPEVGPEMVSAYRQAARFRIRPDRWTPPDDDFAQWYRNTRWRVSGWHLRFEAWRAGAPVDPRGYALWKPPLYTTESGASGFRAALSHAKLASRRITPAWPYLGHPRERLARAAVALGYGADDPRCRAIAARLLGARSIDDESLHTRLAVLAEHAG